MDSAGAHGSISPSGSITVNPGGTQTLTITPYPGYQVADVLVDGSLLGALATYTFSNVTSNHTIEVTFEITSKPPAVTTGSATSVTFSTATLNGTVNPNGASTTYYFEFGTSASYGTTTATADAGYGTVNVSVSDQISGLNPNTTYHFRIVATNSEGTIYGTDDHFTTVTQTGRVDGDVAPLGNRDGIVNVGDALVALRFALGLETPTQEDFQHGDVAPLDANGCPNPDGQITVGDALVILRLALGLINFSNCTPTTTTLTIRLTGVPTGTTFGGLDITIDYDESEVSFNSVVAGTLTSGATVVPNDNSDTIRTGIVQTGGFDGGTSGSIMLFTFDIKQPNIPTAGDFVVTDFSACGLMGADAGLDTSNISLNIVNK